MSESTYVPGVCNINKSEVAYRRKAMWFGVGLSAIVFIAALVLQFAWWVVPIVLFVPVFIAAIGVLQVKNRFCVSYGGSGRQNATDGNESAQAIADKDAVAIDKAKSRKMNLQALGMTIAVLVVCSAIAYQV